MKKTFNFLLAACASIALFACSSDSGSEGLGSNAACTANAECASGICAVVAGGDKCAPASDTCTPACADGQACVDVGGDSGLCLETVSESNGQGGAAGSGEGGAAGSGEGGAAGTDGGNEAGSGGSAGNSNNGGAGGMSNPGGSGGSSDADPGQVACNDMFACFNQCPDGDMNCPQGCFDAAGPEAQNRYQAIFGCASAAGCEQLDGSIDQECLNAECSAELEACFGPTAQPMGTLDCNDYLGCINACPEGDDGSCRFDCTEAASVEGYDTFQAVLSCLNDNDCFTDAGGADTACLEAGGVCGMAWEACTGPAAMPMGDGTCQDFVGCFQDCPQGDSDCNTACVEATSPAGYADYNAVIDCGQMNMCFDDTGAGDQACFDANCAAEQVPCFGEPLTPMGMGDCIALNTCLEACDPMADNDRETCVRPCVEASSQTGYDDLNTLSDCITASVDANGAPCPDVACAQTACGDEAALCYADGQIPDPSM